MAVIQVVYALGTQYIIESMEARFRGILSKAAANGDTVDLGKARLSPTNASHLREYYDKVDFINSEDPELDELLKRNMANARTDIIKYPKLDMPLRPTFVDFTKWAKTLKAGDKYALCPGLSNERQLAFSTMLILKCPGVDWDLSESIRYIYDFVYNEWCVRQESHTEYIEIVGNAIVPRTVQNGMLGSRSGDMTSVRQYIMSHSILPADFGTKDLVRIEKGQAQGEWGDVVHKCVSILVNPEQEIHRLASYLKFRKGV